MWCISHSWATAACVGYTEKRLKMPFIWLVRLINLCCWKTIRFVGGCSYGFCVCVCLCVSVCVILCWTRVGWGFPRNLGVGWGFPHSLAAGYIVRTRYNYVLQQVLVKESVLWVCLLIMRKSWGISIYTRHVIMHVFHCIYNVCTCTCMCENAYNCMWGWGILHVHVHCTYIYIHVCVEKQRMYCSYM